LTFEYYYDKMWIVVEKRQKGGKEMKKGLLWILLLTGLVFLLVGCDDFKVSQSYQVCPQKACPQTAVEDNVRLVLITSDHSYLVDKQKEQKEVLAKLVPMINSGQYNIISVKTSYSWGYLIAAEVTYSVSDRGIGNDLRIIFVTSDKDADDDRSQEVQKKLNILFSEATFAIEKVQTVYRNEDLLAAEVYYRDKQ